MAVYSMTGYAQALAEAVHSPHEAARPAIAVELRSVNSRFLDLGFKIPDELRQLEPLLRDLLLQGLKRGKVELRLATREGGESGWPRPSDANLDTLARLQQAVRARLPDAAPLSVQEALGWCRTQQPGARCPEEWVLGLAREALASLREARAREGDKLAGVLRERVQALRALATEAAPLVPQVVARQQQRFLERWQEALGAADAAGSIPPEALRDRALTEAAAYAIRLDVAEELARLGAHLDEIERLLQKGGEVGKRLDFLIQELHREANTLGSKSAALELSRIAVDMKVAIEQMREQVQNLE